MKQCPDVIKNLKKGDKVIIRDASNASLLGRFIFQEWSVRTGEQTIECISDNMGSMGEQCFTSLSGVVINLAGCTHEWRRLDLFRTTEFHCTKCPAMRPFDKEKDEAA